MKIKAKLVVILFDCMRKKHIFLLMLPDPSSKFHRAICVFLWTASRLFLIYARYKQTPYEIRGFKADTETNDSQPSRGPLSCNLLCCSGAYSRHTLYERMVKTAAAQADLSWTLDPVRSHTLKHMGEVRLQGFCMKAICLQTCAICQKVFPVRSYMRVTSIIQLDSIL